MSDATVTAKISELNESIKSKTFGVEETTKRPFKREIVWKNVAVYIVGHALGLWGLYLSLFGVPSTHIFYGKRFTFRGFSVGDQC